MLPLGAYVVPAGIQQLGQAQVPYILQPSLQCAALAATWCLALPTLLPCGTGAVPAGRHKVRQARPPSAVTAGSKAITLTEQAETGSHLCCGCRGAHIIWPTVQGACGLPFPVITKKGKGPQLTAMSLPAR